MRMNRTRQLITAIVSVCLMLALMGSAMAEPAESAYRQAKEAVSLISYGEYEMALNRLGMQEQMQASTLKRYIDRNCSEIHRGSVQTDVAVAWFDGSVWQIAVPFEAPEDEAVGALVFTLAGDGFSGIDFMRWGDVEASYDVADEVYWNRPYMPSCTIYEDW